MPCPPPGDLPDPETEPISLTSSALAGGCFTTSVTWEAQNRHLLKQKVSTYRPKFINQKLATTHQLEMRLAASNIKADLQ